MMRLSLLTLMATILFSTAAGFPPQTRHPLSLTLGSDLLETYEYAELGEAAGWWSNSQHRSLYVTLYSNDEAECAHCLLR